MKRLGIICAALVLTLFLQVNHMALTALASNHETMPSCGESRTTSGNCLCCVIEQANKSSVVSIVPFSPSLCPSCEVNSSKLSISEISPAYRRNPPPSTNGWLNTVVQRK